jgi:hypothetical protein
MVQILRFDPHMVYPKTTFLQLRVVHEAAQSIEFDRKIGISHLPG